MKTSLLSFFLAVPFFAQAQTYPLPLRFVDSETGYAVQPAVTVSVGDAKEVLPVDATGRVTAQLSTGNYQLEVASRNYHGVSTAVAVSAEATNLRFLLDPVAPVQELQPEVLQAQHRADAMLIVGFVVDDETGAPLPNVVVGSSPSGTKATSDERGFFHVYIPLQNQKESEKTPANLLFEKSGYRGEDRQNVQLYPNGDWVYRIRLVQGDGRNMVDERELQPRSPKHATHDGAPATKNQDSVAQIQTATPSLTSLSRSAATTVRLPQTIRVLLATSAVDYVSLDFYCKHSLPSEWISGWGNYTGGSNSLNAGAVAIRTYAVGYINYPTTTNYDICASTACQVYNSSTTSTLTDSACTYTANYLMVNSSSTISRSLTEYSAENNSVGFACGDGFTGACISDSVCSGETRNGHGRGMCQWGSAKWATGLKFPGNSTSDNTTTNGQPRQDWVWILNHYYPTLTLTLASPLVTNDVVMVISTNAASVYMCGDGSISSGVNCTLVSIKAVGATGVVIGGPTQVTSDGRGYTWYKVQWNDANHTVGWVAENYLERTTADAGPTLATIAEQSVNEGDLLTITPVAGAPDFEESITDFEGYGSGTFGVMFKTPRTSGSTTTFLDVSPDTAVVTAAFPGGNANAGGRVLNASWSWNSTAAPWLRLTTGATSSEPNPVIDFTKKLRFDIYTDKSLNVALGCRETTTAAGTAIGSDGGTTGNIEFVGVSGKNGTTPIPTRTVSASAWTTLTFNMPSEPVQSFTGNGVLSTASGLGVLEHLAFTPNAGIGTYNVYLDNFEVVSAKTLTYSLVNPPSGATINSTNGVVTWTPTHAQAGTNYTITVKATDNGSPSQSGTTSFTVTVYGSPVITAQPASQTKNAGTTANFAVTAGGAATLNYQWKKGTTTLVNSGNIFGATSATLTIANVSQTDADSYSVTVTNSFGFATSIPATLTVVDQPGISVEPASRTNSAGTTATFSVTASGTGTLSYQWRKAAVNLSNGGNVLGANTATLTLTGVSPSDAGSYSVVVTNVAGSATSVAANLTVIVPPSITSQPGNLTVNPGTNATFQVTATGSALSYQWVFNGTNIPTATSGSYTRFGAQASDAGDYFVILSNSAGAVTSSVATLTVNVAAFITTQPQSLAVNKGSDASFSVQAGGTDPLTYQWRFNGTNIAGATASVFLKTNVLATAGGNYSVIVSNVAGQIFSDNALLTVIVPPVITANPLTQTAATASTVKLTVGASGSAPFSYQWLLDGSEIADATQSGLELVNVNTGNSGGYSVIVSNPAGTATSTTAQLTVSPLTDIVPPKVLFTAPAANFRTNGTPLLVKGTASDDVHLAQVLYRVGADDFQPATGLTNWSAVITMTPGTNVLTVKAIDSSGNEFVTNRNFFFVVTSHITLLTNGLGKINSITNNQLLEIGRNYSMTAVAGGGYVFTNWSGDISDTNALTVFRMQTNLTVQANFVPSPFIQAAGMYNGLFSEPIIAHQSAGFATFSVSSNLSFSGKLVIEGDSLTCSGKFFVPGTAHVLVPRLKQGKRTLTVDLVLNFGSDQMTGGVSDGIWTANLLANRGVFDKTTLATSFMGKYTMLIPGTNDAVQAPSGYGYGSVTVSTNGTVQLSGALADNTVVSQSVPVSKDGTWPLYAQMYPSKLIVTNIATNGVTTIYTNINYRGSIQGWLTVSNSPGSLAGTINWIKTGWTNLYYPNGFTNVNEVLGSLYVPPTSGTRAVQITNGFSYLADGNLSMTLSNALTLKTNNLFTISTNNKVTLSLTSTTGLLRGSFVHPDNQNKITTIGGAVLQQQKTGGGFFGGSNQFGVFLLQGTP